MIKVMNNVEINANKPAWYRSWWLLLLTGTVLGALGMLVVRFVTYMPAMVHYHANFAVYLNGKRDDFKSPQYYQSVSICSSESGITTPEQRAHMHENVNSVIHVHDKATTYGQFFENLGWEIGPDFVETDDGTMYRTNDTAALHIIINGQDYTGLGSISNMVIKDKSRLLVSYGALSQATIDQEYKTVPNTAAQQDASTDPASCSGNEKISWKDRLHHLL
jgi:predicted lactoylglutathione lyase